MSLLEDLWYDNYTPQERIGMSARERERLDQILKRREALEEILGEKKELLDLYDDALGMLRMESEEEAFEEGVRFAMRLMIETMTCGKDGKTSHT